MTLVIMAAGMGSRYGGLKQLDPLGPSGEFIIDYSIYDAIRAGFNKVVFVIKRENYDLFRETVGKRIEALVDVKYVFQELTDIPAGCSVPTDRVKPWGTAHAIYACRNVVTEPFAVINADDFYGRDAFEVLGSFLAKAQGHNYCMVGYRLDNTLTENGSVSRGICTVTEDNYLTTIVERTKIARDTDGKLYNMDEERTPLSEDDTVSMNFWGFTTEFFQTLSEGFGAFFESEKDNLSKAEYYLLTAVSHEIEGNTGRVSVLQSDAKWFGVTYREDREKVVNSINTLVREGVYPDNLWLKSN